MGLPRRWIVFVSLPACASVGSSCTAGTTRWPPWRSERLPLDHAAYTLRPPSRDRGGRLPGLRPNKVGVLGGGALSERCWHVGTQKTGTTWLFEALNRHPSFISALRRPGCAPPHRRLHGLPLSTCLKLLPMRSSQHVPRWRACARGSLLPEPASLVSDVCTDLVSEDRRRHPPSHPRSKPNTESARSPAYPVVESCVAGIGASMRTRACATLSPCMPDVFYVSPLDVTEPWGRAT